MKNQRVMNVRGSMAWKAFGRGERRAYGDVSMGVPAPRPRRAKSLLDLYEQRGYARGRAQANAVIRDTEQRG
jgi:hypothetical protein